MIITRTPFRISFAGGGSDLPAYYRENGAAVVSTTIDKYMYVTVNKRFDDSVRVSYTKTEIAERVEDLRHEIVRAALRKTGVDRGVEITTIADIPAGTGLGSSSTLTVGLLHALHAYADRFSGAERLAREACEIEIDTLGQPIGKQDQYAAAYGGLNYIHFNRDDSVLVEPIICKLSTRRRLSESLVLFYTHMQRKSSDILDEQVSKTKQGKANRELGLLVRLAEELHEALCDNRPEAMGKLLHRSWMIKRQIASGISDPRIDEWYKAALDAGAEGGKILGAGGGGFLLLYCEPEEQGRLVRRMEALGLRKIDFAFEGEGSRIIYVEE
jgi:D-glycero-alpha-D-manno-heptose-7-phosphate kinase